MSLAYRLLLVFIGALSSAAASAAEAGWSADLLSVSAPLTVVRQADDAVYLRAGTWLKSSICADERLCFTRSAPPVVRLGGGIPDGEIATAAGRGVVRAWYAEPTDRYRHGVLGDQIEAGALVAEDAAGRRHRIVLGTDFVFEDLTPRLADVDGDGQAEIVTIRSRRDAGAAVAVYGLRNGQLSEIAATAPIGRPNRWLNIAGIADFTGEGRLDIALVKTPHIGGRLEIWTLRSGSLRRVGSAQGFSNHAIGSTELGLSAVADADGDGVADLALPDRQRTALRIVSARGGALQPIATIPVGGRIATAIGVLASNSGPIFLVGLEDGRAIAVSKR